MIKKYVIVVLVVIVVGFVIFAPASTNSDLNEITGLMTHPACSVDPLTAGEQVLKTYSRLENLSFEVKVTQDELDLGLRKKYAFATVRMRKEAFFSQLRPENKIAKELYFYNGELTEINLTAGAPTEVTTSEILVPDGPGDFSLSTPFEQYGCMLGSYASTWVGKETKKGLFFQQAIANSIHAGKSLVDGEKCDVFVEKKGDWRIFYVNSNHLITKFVSIAWENKRPVAVKSRIYSHLSTERIPDSIFEPPTKINVAPLVVAKNGH